VVSAGAQSPEQVQSQLVKRQATTPGTWMLVLGLLLLMATLAVYVPVHRHPFLNMDDDVYVTDNGHVISGLSWTTLKWAVTSYEAFNWHPVTWISHALDCQLFQLNPAGPHDVNVVLHLINVVLVFWVLWRATGYAGRSLMVAALFALHPLNVESVAWIAERKTMLSMLFFLLALGAYRWYAREPRIGRYSVVALLFALGLMAKPQVITLPAVLLLWDYWPLGRFRLGPEQSSLDSETGIPSRSFSQLVAEKIPLFVLCLISAYLTMKAQRVGRPHNWPFTFWIRLENAIAAYARYVQKAFWPSGMAPMYLHPGDSIKLWPVFVALLFLVGVTALVALGWRRRYLTVGWLWFLGTMVPMIGLLQVGRQSMADRYAYLPFLGLFIMLCWGVSDWAQARHLPAALLPTVSIAVLGSLAVVTYRQVNYWGNNVSLWSHTLQVTDRNWFAEYHLGDALKREGQPVEALAHFFNALAVNPTNVESNLAIALYDHQSGNLEEAVDHYKKVAAKTDDDRLRYRVLVNLAAVYKKLGDEQQSQQCLDEAAKLAPQ
jgi:hypothetical protein